MRGEKEHEQPIGETDPVTILRRAGIINPIRLSVLIEEAISFLDLDLSGLTVLTEAASGPFVVTPVIAARAGATRVLALTRDSRYARASEVIAQTRALENLCALGCSVQIFPERRQDLFAEADIVTNLGFVRPIDAPAVHLLKQTAVVSLMCETWEIRNTDVDLSACRKRGIVLGGTNEDYPGLEVFSLSGLLCLKMLLDAQVQVQNTRIIVVSSDKFGPVIERQLSLSGAAVRLVTSLRNMNARDYKECTSLVVADYSRTDVIIGTDGDINAEDLAHFTRGLTVIQFAGRIDVAGLIESGITVYPGVDLDCRRMARTLADLGPGPVVKLHAAGLKVGEMLARGLTSRGGIKDRTHMLPQFLEGVVEPCE